MDEWDEQYDREDDSRDDLEEWELDRLAEDRELERDDDYFDDEMEDQHLDGMYEE